MPADALVSIADLTSVVAYADSVADAHAAAKREPTELGVEETAVTNGLGVAKETVFGQKVATAVAVVARAVYEKSA